MVLTPAIKGSDRNKRPTSAPTTCGKNMSHVPPGNFKVRRAGPCPERDCASNHKPEETHPGARPPAAGPAPSRASRSLRSRSPPAYGRLATVCIARQATSLYKEGYNKSIRATHWTPWPEDPRPIGASFYEAGPSGMAGRAPPGAEQIKERPKSLLFN
ncbi:hypothetical protein SKAU_G00085650 [Synaphobranchus kaupii]|uniref:Uncharacterized protein n=1 Tax=Synaphobranchus kaupii TaxID=118154 RepID=A0A9Q1J4W7_SYNKA|nr:hypothetical protein SKAU_G00085650 [Synaphobranchus kaupii]